MTTPTIVTTPCFSGAPWDLGQLTPLADPPRAPCEGIPDATEVVIPRTGHMFRFAHPVTYATAIRDATHPAMSA